MKKRILTAIIALVAAMSLVGCADYGQYAEGQSKVAENNSKLVAAYFGAGSARDAAIMQALGAKGDSSAAVLYAVLQGQRDAQVIGAFRSEGLEAPTTGMDVANTFFGTTLGTVARWGFGYLIASDLIDALGAGVTVGGDYVNNTNTAGGDLNSTFSYSPTDYSAGNDINIDSLNTTSN